MNLSLETALVAMARDLGINVSRAAETGLRAAVAAAQADAWREQIAAAIESANAYAVAQGLPLARYRAF